MLTGLWPVLRRIPHDAHQQAAAVSYPVANPKPCSAAAARAATAATAAETALQEKAIQTPHAVATCHTFLCLRHGRLSVILLHVEYSLHSSEDGYSIKPLAILISDSHSVLGMTMFAPSDKGQGEHTGNAAVVAPHDGYAV